jgi:hypothetical protein
MRGIAAFRKSSKEERMRLLWRTPLDVARNQKLMRVAVLLF